MARKTQMNNITNPELLSQVNNENVQLLEDFVNYLRSTQIRESTINGYINDIQIAFVWNLLYNNNAFYCDWTKRQIVRYQNWLLNENHNSPARIKRLKAALSSMGNYVENILDDDYPNFRNIINKVKSPVSQPVREKTVFTNEEIVELIELLVKNKKYDKACALALALYSGRRKAEILRFRVSDFTKDKLVCDGALYKSDPIETKGGGANGKQLECFCLAEQFNPYLDKWLKYREENNIDSVWLFPSKNDRTKHLPISTMNSWAKTFTRLLHKDFYWHSIRHLTVTNFKRAGIPDTVIKEYMGWADISMVPVYSDMQAEEQLGMYFTRDGITKPDSRNLSEI